MRSARHALGEIRRGTRYRSLALAAVRGDRPVIAYVGWTGEGNLGDEAMYAMHVAHLGFVADLVPVPIADANPILRAIGPRIDAICLGGGTLIANGFFRRGLTAVMEAAPQARRFMIGVGSESPDYRGGRRAAIDLEFARWPAILSEFEAVRVRGPLSVKAMSSIGVDATHTGDPALLLPKLAVEPDPMIVGINVGLTDDQWGGDAVPPTDLLQALIDLVLSLGLRVRLVPTTAQDHAFMKSFCAVRPLAGVEMPAQFYSVSGLLKFVGECGSLVGMKLHALILAATQHVPLIALEYRPKCRDFMASVGLEEACYRTDDIDIASLAGTLSKQLGSGDAARAAIAQHVTTQNVALRLALATEITAINR